jgi:hypothetical protein
VRFSMNRGGHFRVLRFGRLRRGIAAAAAVGVASMLGAVALTAPAVAATGVTFDDSPGVGAPPATLGGYVMSPFSVDTRNDVSVASVSGPTGDIGFSPSLVHTQVGYGWATWSNGYYGDVYTTAPALSVTISLPPSTSAFYFYAEPDPFSTFDITATTSDGATSGAVPVYGAYGAQYFGFYTDGSVQLESITVSSDVDFALGEFGINGTGAMAPPVNYLAMGDSYSSGESVSPYLDSDGCDRSTQAYPQLLAWDNSWDGANFIACSGATTADVLTTGQNNEQPQLARLDQLDDVDGANINLITMTLGGDDIGFKSIIEYCVAEHASQFGSILYWTGWHSSGAGSCADDSSFALATQATIADEWTTLLPAFKTIAAHEGPNTSMLVADYPQIFPPNTDQEKCAQLSPYFTVDDQQWFRQLTVDLDLGVKQAANLAGVNFVNVLDEFNGHAICDSAGAWLNSLTNVNGWDDVSGSFHPNASGQAGYAQAFENYISNAVADGTPLTTAGMPADPGPSAGGSSGGSSSGGGGGVVADAALAPAAAPADATSGQPQLNLGSLTVTPVEAQPGCDQVLQGGEEVAVSGSGYAAGAPVVLNLLDDVSGTPTHTAVATLTADANGDVNTTLRLPLGMAGMTTDGSDPLGYLQATGAGAASAQALDNDLFEVAPHGASCGHVDALPFQGFTPPVSNYPAINAEHAGRTIPVKFSLPSIDATLGDVVMPGYPQSAPVSCVNPPALTAGTPTEATSAGSQSGATDKYNYLWATDPSWRGCREFILQLADGSYHTAVMNFTG